MAPKSATEILKITPNRPKPDLFAIVPQKKLP